MKAIILSDYSKIYEFDRMEYSGFQFGDPAKDNRCELVFFDRSGQAYEVALFYREEDSRQIRQPRVNGMIRSFGTEGRTPGP